MEFELFYQTSGVCTDTRNITKDCLFICLKGANFNGNEYAEIALAKGAKYVICDEAQYALDPSIFLVTDALKYLQDLGNYHRKKFNIPIIGITGSNGKTTTKELIAHFLGQHFNVHFTAGNLNNHIGVPLTLLQLNETHQIAVIEMGANKFGDIEELCLIAEPTHGIITNIGSAHLEGFLSFEGVKKTKKELYDFVAKHDGTLFYNEDDTVLTSILPAKIQSISYAAQKQADIQGNLLQLTPFIEMKWEKANYQSPILLTKMIGKYNFYNFLAAITIANYFEVPTELINDAIRSFESTNNRSQIVQTANNTLIMDAYNANPSSMKSALESFAMIDHTAKLAILGDMFELGDDSEKEHANIVQLVQELKLNALFVGQHFYAVKNNTPTNLHFFIDKSALELHLTSNIPTQQLILLKGSRGVGLESITPTL